jgi:hypothetical protein
VLNSHKSSARLHIYSIVPPKNATLPITAVGIAVGCTKHSQCFSHNSVAASVVTALTLAALCSSWSIRSDFYTSTYSYSSNLTRLQVVAESALECFYQ